MLLATAPQTCVLSRDTARLPDTHDKAWTAYIKVLCEPRSHVNLVVMQRSTPQLKQNVRLIQSFSNFCVLLEDVKKKVHLQVPGYMHIDRQPSDYWVRFWRHGMARASVQHLLSLPCLAYPVRHRRTDGFAACAST